MGESVRASRRLAVGRVPSLARIEIDFLPIHLRLGRGLGAGCVQSLCDCAWKALSAKDRESLTLKEAARPEELSSCSWELSARCSTALRSSCVDQFDDYQSRHRSLFLRPNRKTWLSATNLVKKNAFGDLQNLLAGGAVRCVIATRSDAADGLDRVRVVPPRTYRVERLEKGDWPNATHSTDGERRPADPVVAAPEAGWERLKNGSPAISTRTVPSSRFRCGRRSAGSPVLPAFTPRAYDREGSASRNRSGVHRAADHEHRLELGHEQVAGAESSFRLG